MSANPLGEIGAVNQAMVDAINTTMAHDKRLLQASLGADEQAQTGEFTSEKGQLIDVMA